MICLVACLIWTGNTGHFDLCKKESKIVYETDNYQYVQILDYKEQKISKDVKIEIQGEFQQLNKDACRIK